MLKKRPGRNQSAGWYMNDEGVVSPGSFVVWNMPVGSDS